MEKDLTNLTIYICSEKFNFYSRESPNIYFSLFILFTTKITNIKIITNIFCIKIQQLTYTRSPLVTMATTMSTPVSPIATNYDVIRGCQFLNFLFGFSSRGFFVYFCVATLSNFLWISSWIFLLDFFFSSGRQICFCDVISETPRWKLSGCLDVR